MGNQSTVIFAQINVAGFHCWPDAPRHREYLRALHRHDFVIIGEKEVKHSNRAVEFHDLCEDLQRAVSELYSRNLHSGIDFGAHSCETIAAAICEKLHLDACIVMEDGINGAKVHASSLPTA